MSAGEGILRPEKRKNKERAAKKPSLKKK